MCIVYQQHGCICNCKYCMVLLILLFWWNKCLTPWLKKKENVYCSGFLIFPDILIALLSAGLFVFMHHVWQLVAMFEIVWYDMCKLYFATFFFFLMSVCVWVSALDYLLHYWLPHSVEGMLTGEMCRYVVVVLKLQYSARTKISWFLYSSHSLMWI